MLGVRQKFPEFSVKAVVSSDAKTGIRQVSLGDFKGKWKIFFFWPKDFTFVCPTEISAFGELNDEFAKRNAQVLGCSIDSDFVHLAWRNQHPDLNNLPFPMLSDIKHELCNALGVLDSAEGVAQRATFIVDPDNIIRFVMVTDLGIGRNTEEVLRVLDALQSGGLTACNWKRGDALLKV